MTDTRGPIERVSDRILTIPNLLSMIRLLLVPVFIGAMLLEYDAIALIILFVSGITDYLDGLLARRWDQVSRLGQLLDPIADRLYITSTVILMGIRDIVPWWLVVLLMLRDGILTIATYVMSWYGYRPLQVEYIGKAATFNLLSAFPLLLWGNMDWVGANVVTAMGWAFAGWGIGLYWWSGLEYSRQIRLVIRGARAADTAGASTHA